MSDTVQMAFRYAVGQRVCWAAQPDTIWRICSRHWHDNGQETEVTYGLLPEDHPARPAWCGYPESALYEETGPAELAPLEQSRMLEAGQ